MWIRLCLYERFPGQQLVYSVGLPIFQLKHCKVEVGSGMRTDIR